MQNQQERERELAEEKPAKRRRERRSWGELIAIVLVLGTGLIQLLFTVVPACVTLFCGIALLFRARKWAKWAMMVEAFMALAVALGYAYMALLTFNDPRGFGTELVVYSAILLSVSILFYTFGRWLGRQEYIED